MLESSARGNGYLRSIALSCGPARRALDERAHCGAEAVPAGRHEAREEPAEHPGDGV